MRELRRLELLDQVVGERLNREHLLVLECVGGSGRELAAQRSECAWSARLWWRARASSPGREFQKGP